MDTSVIRRIHALREMTVAELRSEWQRIHGEPARSSNRSHLWRRLAWKIQAEAHGGLSNDTKRNIDALAPARGHGAVGRFEVEVHQRQDRT